jgi:hypothetical protein
MQDVLFYKGLFAASVALIVLGAWYGREGRREVAEAEKANELTSGSGGQLDYSAPATERIEEER